MNLNNRLLTIIGLIGVATALNAFREIKISTDLVNKNNELFTEIYNYGFPIVLMNYSKKSMLSKKGLNVNTFDHMTYFPDWSYEEKVKPNVDTFYSSLWLDLSDGPIVVNVPATERYYILPALDAYTNIFSDVGTRTTGSVAHLFVYTGPEWEGEIPKGMEEIKCPTNMVWIMGRIEGRNTVEDVKAVKKLQDDIYAKPLSEWDNKNYKYNLPSEVFPYEMSALEFVESLCLESFITEMSYLMAQNPPPVEDQPIISKMKEVGINIGDSYSLGSLSIVERELYKFVPENVQDSWVIKERNADKEPWKFYKRDIGTYGTNYKRRAYIASIGFGANLPSDTVYPMTTVDKKLDPLCGQKKYILHFDKDQLPFVNGFWSLTCYNSNGYLTHNDINRYAVGDRDYIQFNEDGTLDIYLQNTKPDGVPINNWLPTPKDDSFSLVLRMYWPQKGVFSVNYELPSVTLRD